MSGRLDPVKFPSDVLSFYVGVSKLAALARARGDLAPDGNPIWSVNEWKAFCRGVRSYSHTRSLGLGMAAYRTCVEVEAWIASGMDAFDIHEALRDGGVEQEIHRLKQLESSERRPVYYQAEIDR